MYRREGVPPRALVAAFFFICFLSSVLGFVRANDVDKILEGYAGDCDGIGEIIVDRWIVWQIRSGKIGGAAAGAKEKDKEQ